MCFEAPAKYTNTDRYTDTNNTTYTAVVPVNFSTHKVVHT